MMRRLVPWGMIWLRMALGPGIVAGARLGWEGRWLGLIVLAGLVDDILDGMLARRWNCATPGLRRADSWADTVFYLGVAGAMWLREKPLMQESWRLLAAVAGMQMLRHGFDWWKFGRVASYHSYLAKFWGLVLASATMGVLSFGGPRWLFVLALVVGIAADVDGMLMSVVLPRWQNDVKGIWVALRLRREMLEGAAWGENARRESGV